MADQHGIRPVCVQAAIGLMDKLVAFEHCPAFQNQRRIEASALRDNYAQGWRVLHDQALIRLSSARIFSGSSVLSIFCVMVAISAMLDFSTCCFTVSRLEGCIENSRKPKPSNMRVSSASPAISPQTATGTPA